MVATRAVGKQVIEAVANMLGNTATVCRKSYVDPRVLDGWAEGRLQRAAKGARHGGLVVYERDAAAPRCRWMVGSRWASRLAATSSSAVW